MAQLDTTNTFVDGNVIHAADLNNLIDQATALSGIIIDQTSVATIDATADQMLIHDASAAGPNRLRRALISALPGAGTVTSVSATAAPASVFNISVGTPSSTPAIALSLDNQAAGKVLAGPVSGTATTPTFRVLSPSDLPVATVLILANQIDWNLGSVFTKSLTAATHNLSFINPSEGQTIRVHLAQDATGGRNVNWATTPAVRWPGGTAPVMTPGSARHDIYTFHYINGFTGEHLTKTFHNGNDAS